MLARVRSRARLSRCLSQRVGTSKTQYQATRPLKRLRYFSSVNIQSPDKEAQEKWAAVISRLASEEDKRLQSPVDSAHLGMYGLEGILSEGDFERLRERVTAECLVLRHAIMKAEARLKGRAEEEALDRYADPNVAIIRALDSISARLCVALDGAEVCQSSHSNALTRAAASQSYGALASFVGAINVDEELYRPLVKVLENVDMQGKENGETDICLSPEELRVAQSLRKEFERDGIHLSAEAKALLAEVQLEARSAEANFIQVEQSQDTGTVAELELSFKESCALALDSDVGPIISRYGRLEPASIPPSYMLRLESGCVKSLLQHSKDGSLRERCYRTAYGVESVRASCSALRDLVERRHEMSNALGFTSYADFCAGSGARLVQSPDQVLSFLDQVSQAVKPRATVEAAKLLSLKREMAGHTNSCELEAWDIDFLMQQHMSRAMGPELAKAKQYLSIETCVRGFSKVCKCLFGLDLVPAPLAPHEGWAPDVQRLELLEEGSGALAGVLYLDLYHRVGKYNKAAHYQVQSSHSRRPLSAFLRYCDQGLPPKPQTEERRESYQIPSSVLTCSFDKAKPNLEPAQALTMWHEFGHAINALCSRTQLQHLSGTRGEMDFVETPSQLFEYYATEPRALLKWAVDDDGRPMPLSVAQAIAGTRNEFRGLELQLQILFAACDMKLFSAPGTGSDPWDKHPEPYSAEGMSLLMQTMQDRLYPEVPFVPETFPLAHFSHFASYGSSYYVYIQSRVFAADIWHSCFASDPFSRKAGERYRREILEPGGSRDPNKMLQGLLGRPSSAKALISEINQN